MARHYHVVCWGYPLRVTYTPGYMPESNPTVWMNRRAAVDYAAILARKLREDGYRVYGEDGDYYGERDPDDLGRVIQTIECNDMREECEGVG